MPSEAQVHAALDSATAAAFVGTPVIYTNQELKHLSQGEADFVKQSVDFTEANQFELGNTGSSRKRGIIVFMIYTRMGTGAAGRNALLRKVVDSFRSKVIGGATLLNARTTVRIELERWYLTGIEIPFFFYDSED